MAQASPRDQHRNTAPSVFEELRGVLLREHAWRQREGL